MFVNIIYCGYFEMQILCSFDFVLVALMTDCFQSIHVFGKGLVKKYRGVGRSRKGVGHQFLNPW